MEKVVRRAKEGVCCTIAQYSSGGPTLGNSDYVLTSMSDTKNNIKRWYLFDPKKVKRITLCHRAKDNVRMLTDWIKHGDENMALVDWKHVYIGTDSLRSFCYDNGIDLHIRKGYAFLIQERNSYEQIEIEDVKQKSPDTDAILSLLAEMEQI